MMISLLISCCCIFYPTYAVLNRSFSLVILCTVNVLFIVLHIAYFPFLIMLFLCMLLIPPPSILRVFVWWIVIEQVHARADDLAVGKLSLNLTCFSKEIVSVFGKPLSAALKNLLPFTFYIPLTVEYLNTVSLVPKKNYDTNRYLHFISPSEHGLLPSIQIYSHLLVLILQAGNWSLSTSWRFTLDCWWDQTRSWNAQLCRGREYKAAEKFNGIAKGNCLPV